MYYVEFLRVFRALRIFTICLAALLLIAFIGRISAGTHWSNLWIESQDFSPSAKKTVQIGPGGSETTTIVDKEKGIRLVQVRSPGKLDVMLYETPQRFQGHTHHGSHVVGRDNSGGGIHINEYTAPDGTHITHYLNDRHMPVDIFLVLAGLLAAIFASVIGGSLSKENDGHLELAWTKPASRQKFAFTMFGIDALGIIAAGFLAFLTAVTIAGIFLGRPVLVGSPDTTGNIVLALLFPISWYALGQALTASARRAGPIIGMLWVVGIACIATVAVPNPIIQLIVRIFNTVNPLAYYLSENGHASSVNGISATLLSATQFSDILGLCAITLIAITASLVQWRRLEA